MFRTPAPAPASFIEIENQPAFPSFSSERNHLFLNGNSSPFRYEEAAFDDQDDEFLFQNQSSHNSYVQEHFPNSFLKDPSSFNQEDTYILQIAKPLAPLHIPSSITPENIQNNKFFSKVFGRPQDDFSEEKLDDPICLRTSESITTAASKEGESNSEVSSPGQCRRSTRNVNSKRPEYNQQVLTRQTVCLSDPSKQNLKKNFPVSIALRVRESSLKYLDYNYQNQEHIIFYLANLIQMKLPTSSERKAYKDFLMEVRFSGKTYQAIKEQFRDYASFMEVFLACIVGFLSDDGQNDFEDWLKSNKKMHESNKQLLRKDKFQLIESFQEQLSL
jgi:hypothetical protein